MRPLSGVIVAVHLLSILVVPLRRFSAVRLQQLAAAPPPDVVGPYSVVRLEADLEGAAARL